MNKEMTGSLGWGVGLVALALGATFARKLGYIDADAVTRIVMCAIGLMVAWFGNRMPKALVTDANARKITRIGGWSMLLSGALYAALWAFASFDVAVLLGCAAIFAGIMLTTGYGIALRGQHKPTA